MGSIGLKPVNTKSLQFETTAKDDEVIMVEDEPLSPAARLLQTPQLSCSVVVVFGSETTFDVNSVKMGLENTLIKIPRFSSLPVMDDKKDGGMRWRRTKVNVDNHVFNPDLELNMASPDEFVEDYISDLSKTLMDLAKPLWEFHILNIKTSDANAVAVLRIHHSIGDGISLISVLLACSRKASDSEALPSLPKSKRATTTSSHSSGFWRFLLTIWTTIVMILNTFVDVMLLAATALFFKDTNTPIKGASGVGSTPKRMVHRIVSLNDIKLVKTSMDTTINDVLVGLTEAGLSRYLNGRYASSQEDAKDNLPKGIRLRAALYVNIRPSAGIEALAEMMENESNNLKLGNGIGYVLLPFNIALRDDPLNYIRSAKKSLDRKKLSLEAVCSFATCQFIFKLFGIKAVADMVQNMMSKTTISFSNVVGPQEAITLFGHPVAYLAPTVYELPQALTIHWQSYSDKMILVLTADPNVIPDPHKLCTDMEVSLKLIKDAAMERKDRSITQL